MLFNKQVTEKRYKEVRDEYLKLLDGWEAKQTNGDELYEEAGSWQEVDMNKFTTITWEDSWKSMPVKAIEYLKGLKEFDAEIFKKITYLDATEEMVEITVDNKTFKISRKSADELKKNL